MSVQWCSAKARLDAVGVLVLVLVLFVEDQTLQCCSDFRYNDTQVTIGDATPATD